MSPAAEEVLLPPYEGIALADIVLVDTAALADEVAQLLLAESVIGLDTESKPTFAKGEVSTGPHLIQLATDSKAYLFHVAYPATLASLKSILEAPALMKVGFGLQGDLAQLRSKLGVTPQNIVDLATTLRNGKNMLGAKAAVALYFGQRMQKSRKATTSNWANPRMTERQMRYAADDAQVAIRVYRKALGNQKSA